MDSSDSIYEDLQRLFEAMTAGNPNIPMPEFLTFPEVKLAAE